MDWFEFESKCLDCGVCWTSGVDGKLFIFSRSYCSQYVESIDWLNIPAAAKRIDNGHPPSSYLP